MKPAKDADELMENMRKVIEDIRSIKKKLIRRIANDGKNIT